MGSAGYFYPLARVREQVEALQGLLQGHATALAGAAERRTLSVAKCQGPSQRARESPPAATETGDVEGTETCWQGQKHNVSPAAAEPMQSSSNKLHKGLLSRKTLRLKWPFYLWRHSKYDKPQGTEGLLKSPPTLSCKEKHKKRG